MSFMLSQSIYSSLSLYSGSSPLFVQVIVLVLVILVVILPVDLVQCMNEFTCPSLNPD